MGFAAEVIARQRRRELRSGVSEADAGTHFDGSLEISAKHEATRTGLTVGYRFRSYLNGIKVTSTTFSFVKIGSVLKRLATRTGDSGDLRSGRHDAGYVEES